MDRVLLKNIELWMKSCPKEAVLVPYVDRSNVKSTLTSLKEPNLLVNGMHLHSEEGALAEAEEWFSSLELRGVSSVVVYGVGLGYYYDAIEGWLKKRRDRSLIFLEDDLAVIHELLLTDRGTNILKNPQVELLYFRDLKTEGTFEALYWNLSMSKFVFTSLNSYKTHRPKEYGELQHKISFDAAMNNAFVDEYIRYGVGFHLNFYQNLLSLHKASLGNDMFGKFNGIPAIICGAGPSLDHCLPLLKSADDRALIFAGGSALNVLSKAGLRPHFGAGIDPNPIQAQRLKDSAVEGLPFFYRNRMNHAAFEEIKGPRLYITGAGGFNTPKFFEERLGIDREWIDEGHNVINFIVELASAMGCNPIIFVGMDLAYTDMKGYSSGVTEDAKVESEQILGGESDDDRAILKEDIFGKPTYTLWKWIAESQWIGKYAATHPELLMVNATGGGIGIPGVENKPFDVVLKEMLSEKFELPQQITKAIKATAMPQVTEEKIRALMGELEQSLRRVMGHLQDLIEDVDLQISRRSEGQSGLAALAETELVEEPGYIYVLEPFGDVIGRVMAKEARLIGIRRYSKAARIVKRLELKKKKLIYLRDVAEANAELILYTINRKNTTTEPTENTERASK